MKTGLTVSLTLITGQTVSVHCAVHGAENDPNQTSSVTIDAHTGLIKAQKGKL